MSADATGEYIVAGHQPNFFPWFGYFEKMLKADVFVFSDDVQYPKRNYVNRVEIPVNGAGFQWSLPVQRGGDERIANKRFVRDEKSLDRAIKTARFNFGGLPHGRDIEPFLDIFATSFRETETVADLNIRTIGGIAGALGIATRTVRGSELSIEATDATDRLVKRLQTLGGTVYLGGQGSKDYLDLGAFAAAGLAVRWIDYDLGRKLLGDDLPYSILHGIARHGTQRLAEAIGSWRGQHRPDRCEGSTP